MPVWNLGPLDRFEISKINDKKATCYPHKDDFKTTSTRSSVSSPNDKKATYHAHKNYNKATSARPSVSSPPPSYREIDDDHTPQRLPVKHRAPPRDLPEKHRAPPQAQPPCCVPKQIRRERLCRYIVEIVALTFAVDFDKLNATIYDGLFPEGITTNLSDSERVDLLALSTLVRKVHNQLAHGGSFSIIQSHERRLCEHIVTPGEWSDIGLGRYALDMIAWYGEHASISI